MLLALKDWKKVTLPCQKKKASMSKSTCNQLSSDESLLWIDVMGDAGAKYLKTK